MSGQNTSKETIQKLTLISLTWPIFIELGLHMLMGNMDTFMLSQYDDRAVAAVGVANQLAAMINIMFGFVAAGTTILVSRYLGARQFSSANEAATTSLTLSFLIGLLLSILLVLMSETLLGWIGLEEALIHYGKSYLSITGSFMFIQAMLLTASAVIKGHGLTRHVMFITIGMNIINMIGNYLFIFGPFGFPVLGVTGVAISTVISRCAGLAVMIYLLVRILGAESFWTRLIRPVKKRTVELLRIGIPSASEQLFYNTSQLVIISFIAMIGTTALVTKIYTFNIIFLITIFTVAIGQGTQILVSRFIGAVQYANAYSQGLRSLGFGMLVTFLMAGIINLIGGHILAIFTDDIEVINLGKKLLLFSFILEPGRAFNLIIINSLRAAGDVKYPVIMGILFMWGLSIPAAYFFGIHLGMGLTGIFIALILDEWIRGLLMLRRWQSRKWQKIMENEKQQQTEANRSRLSV